MYEGTAYVFCTLACAGPSRSGRRSSSAASDRESEMFGVDAKA
jgi:hypothetical protein